mmetsp:Transcript_18764/g.55792  ORF Transcript_18764/g.55792 Transcript_18764/m.55792 type:complete len:200 (+) Transcript_18764:234-833(+)
MRACRYAALFAALFVAAARADDDVEVYDEEELSGNATEPDAWTDLGGMIDGVKQQIFKGVNSGAKPQTAREAWDAFSSAVDWKENWIRGLLAWHGVMWATFFLTRKNFSAQCGLFFGVAAIVAAAEPLNGLAKKHWQRFSGQDYFDEHGIFTCIVLCAPLLALSFAMMINFVFMASFLLVDVKRRELKDHLKEQAKKTQ